MTIDDIGHPGQLVDPETGLVSRRIFTDLKFTAWS